MNRKVLSPLVKLTAFATVTVLLTAMLAQTLGALSDGGTTYRARFTDVTGLLVGDDVRIAGVRVGRVSGIRVVDDAPVDSGRLTAGSAALRPLATHVPVDSARSTAGSAAPGPATTDVVAEVAFTVAADVPLATSVRAKIRYRNLVGQRYVALSEAPGDGRPLRPGGLIPLAQTAPALDLTVLFAGFRPLFTALTPGDVNKLAYEIIQVLQGEGGTVASLLRRTASLTNTLADRDAVIGRVVSNLNAVLSTLEARDQNLDQTISQLQQFVSGLSADRVALGEALTNLSELTGATAALLHDARPSLAADVASLNDLAGTLNRNADVIDGTLGRLPGRYQALTRVASYGSWFNFFLCDFDGRVALPTGGAANPATFSSSQARCATPGGIR